MDALELAAALQHKEDRKAAGILVVAAITFAGLIARDLGSAAKLRPAV